MRASIRSMALVSAILAAALSSAPAAAEPAQTRVISEQAVGGSLSHIDVYSPAMGRVVTNRVLRAEHAPAPTLYLLTGIGGGVDGISWWADTDVRKFFAGKHVNVVMPIGGAFSLYTDWQTDDPVLGRNRWQTYFTRELPAVVDSYLGTTGRNAVAGVSASAGSAVDLAIQAPDRYQAVAAYSGCPWAADAAGVAFIGAQVIRGGGNPLNMWGLPGNASWHAHDAFAHAAALTGKAIYLSAASGIPGRIDDGGWPFPPVETVADLCTTAFAVRLSQLHIPATHIAHAQGSHTWGLFETDLHNSWPLLSRAIDA